MYKMMDVKKESISSEFILPSLPFVNTEMVQFDVKEEIKEESQDFDTNLINENYPFDGNLVDEEFDYDSIKEEPDFDDPLNHATALEEDVR